MSLVVDVSIALPWNIRSQATPLSDAASSVVISHGGSVPFHFHLEHGNALLMLERRGRISKADVDAAIADMIDMDLAIDTEPLSEIERSVLPLARRHNLSTYDAAYLELALRLGLPLATRDLALANAARDAGAALFSP
ncbi:MAG: type II toxin-antitoxin system VapC family toxin [Hyphomicrobium sp.]|nr:type II toxin-antitoxin system VapC family toxin [Hyphomicrobium sp.]